jgi:hypothetical protein
LAQPVTTGSGWRQIMVIWLHWRRSAAADLQLPGAIALITGRQGAASFMGAWSIQPRYWRQRGGEAIHAG